mmetsp:Transcript_5118/g.9396  ORF Transcript_5118/g.9396 Transcript_5118/m.9396 type:complete len:162 (+) Transcript_5118:92-577(+)
MSYQDEVCSLYISDGRRACDGFLILCETDISHFISRWHECNGSVSRLGCWVGITLILLSSSSHMAGSGPNDRKGNIRFRKIVKSQKTEYLAASYRPEKKKIAQRVVDVTRENGARFLRRATANEREKLGIPKDIDEAWLLMDDNAVLEKAKQALRQKAGKQ